MVAQISGSAGRGVEKKLAKRRMKTSSGKFPEDPAGPPSAAEVKSHFRQNAS